MFSLSGISGPVFQGTLESLPRLPPVTRRRPVAAVRRVAEQIEPEPGTLAAAGTTAARPRQAVEAYQAMLPGNLDRGPL